MCKSDCNPAFFSLTLPSYATSLNSGLVLDELLPRISELQESMKTLTREKRMAQASHDTSLSNLPFLEDQAKRVISSALTIAEVHSASSNASVAEVTTGSELGDALDSAKMDRIATWASSAPTLVRDARSNSGLGASYQAARGSMHSSTKMSPHLSPHMSPGEKMFLDYLDDDDEDDFMLDHVGRYLKKGNNHFAADQLRDAEDYYQRALHKAASLTPQQQDKLDIPAVQLTLGMIAQKMEDFDKAEARLRPIADSETSLPVKTLNGLKDTKRRLDACQMLAEIFFARDDLLSAEAYCMKALQGRYKIRTSEPTLYHSSAQLMARIARSKGDEEDARMFSDMVPGQTDEPEVVPGVVPETAPAMPETRSSSLYEPISHVESGSIIELPSRPFQRRSTSDDLETVSAVARSVSSDILSPPTRSNTNLGQYAVEDPVTVNVLVQNGFDPSSRNFDADAVLYWAAKTGDENIVQQVIRGFAFSYGQKKMKSRVVKARNFDFVHSTEGFTPLMIAASRGHTGTVNIILAAKAKVNGKTKSDKRTALHLATIRGHVKAIEALIRGGAEIDGTDSLGNTALHLAATMGETEVVPLLLNAGANREAKTTAGCTPLHLAVLSHQEEVVGTLLHGGARVGEILAPITPQAKGQSPTSITAQTLDPETTGPPIPPLQQPTALHLAATTGVTRILSVLLLPSFRANIEVKTADGRTPLHAAVLAGQASAVILLLNKGADIEGRDIHGRTPLSFAAGMGSVANLPRARPSSSGSPTGDGGENVPTHITILLHLLRHGASPVSREDDGCTPLHVAAFEGDLAAIRLLLQYGADPTLKRAGGLTARDLAKKVGLKEVVKLLDEGKAAQEQEQKGKRGKTKILGLGMGRKLTIGT